MTSGASASASPSPSLHHHLAECLNRNCPLESLLIIPMSFHSSIVYFLLGSMVPHEACEYLLPCLVVSYLLFSSMAPHEAREYLLASLLKSYFLLGSMVPHEA